jgi:hypothetical protein
LTCPKLILDRSGKCGIPKRKIFEYDLSQGIISAQTQTYFLPEEPEEWGGLLPLFPPLGFPVVEGILPPSP